MDTLKDTIIKQILQDGLDNSMSYAEYRDLVLTKVENNSNTGHEVNEALANYTMLNSKRMKRWDKTIKIGEGVADAIKHKTFNQTWIIITESWCGDAAHVMPVINKIAELNDGINFRVVLRDDNEALMDQFLTNGSRSIAKLIILDTITKDVIATYGPRPSTATLLVNDYKAKYGKLTPEFKEDLQQWYNKDKGHTVIADLVALIG
ncbi:thioredoxin family protein [Olleya sp. UBA1516]|uniref:thioredoxin family protein n=1 Tax=Olleya sp. UBA1516 TaxID=1947013 RepID=UPI0025F5D3CC|nr:thioredoxin family protein [Olleya sp. UBA1516]|tara:strand:+ start:7163 stop:7780 length:618 start_codon:yes stop_codon:yes gene_type:complete